jgi:hypothetical protein
MYRVIQWTTGNVGRRALRAIAEHRDLELVGVFAHGADKVGRDAGELCGLPRTGVIATDDVEALLALRADCVNYNPLFPDYGVLERFLAAGTNVVTTTAFMTGNHLRPGQQERLRTAALRGGASLFGSGINPGIANLITAALTGMCDRVHSVSMTETADCSGYASPGSWELFGWGKPPGNQIVDPSANPMTGAFYDGMDLIADALGVELDDHSCTTQFAITPRDLDLGWMFFAKGTVAGQRTSFVGSARGRAVIRLSVVWKMCEELEPHWSGPEGYLIEIEGEPRVRSVVELGQPTVPGLSREPSRMDLIMIATAMPAVNAIPAVCRARPGIVSYADLPLVGAPGALVP